MKAVSLTQPAVEGSTVSISSETSETLRQIEDRRTADYLMDPKRGWRYFWPFLATERSPSEVSRLIDVPLNQLHYHIKIMLELDLIRLSRT
jgi:Helix-turn-helix domain